MRRSTTTPLKRHALALGLALAVIFTVVGLTSPAAQAQSSSDESALFAATNQARADNGLPALQYDSALSQIANAWADVMAGSQSLQHNPNLVDQINNQVTSDWTRIGENVGYASSVGQVQAAFMNSAPHRGNILGDYNRVGVGATRDGNGRLWVVVDFVKGPSIGPTNPPPPPPPAVRPVSWYLRNSTSAGPPDAAFSYGITGYQFVSGDWNGDGRDGMGVFSNGNWYLRNSTTSGAPDISFAYGAPGYVPVVGDWNGDGKDTVGVYFDGWFYLRNSNTPGPPDIVVHYGAPGYTPVVGDWNGDGRDGIGVYINGWWYLRNTASGGAPDFIANYGAPGYTPIVGDWNGDGVDTIGVYVGGWWYLRNSASGGSPNQIVNYGAAGYMPVVGQWKSGGPSGLGVIIPN